jgi:hypothetical protein
MLSSRDCVVGDPASAYWSMASTWQSLNIDFFAESPLCLDYEKIPLLTSLKNWTDYLMT